MKKKTKKKVDAIISGRGKSRTRELLVKKNNKIIAEFKRDKLNQFNTLFTELSQQRAGELFQTDKIKEKLLTPDKFVTSLEGDFKPKDFNQKDIDLAVKEINISTDNQLNFLMKALHFPKKKRDQNLKVLLETNPATYGKVLAKNPQLAQTVCDIAKVKVDDDKSDLFYRKAFVYSSVAIVGFAGLATGLGVAASSVTIPALLSSVALSTVEISHMQNKLYQKRQIRELANAAYFAGGFEDINQLAQYEDEIESTLMELKIHLGLSALELLTIVPIAKGGAKFAQGSNSYKNRLKGLNEVAKDLSPVQKQNLKKILENNELDRLANFMLNLAEVPGKYKSENLRKISRQIVENYPPDQALEILRAFKNLPSDIIANMTDHKARLLSLVIKGGDTNVKDVLNIFEDREFWANIVETREALLFKSKKEFFPDEASIQGKSIQKLLKNSLDNLSDVEKEFVKNYRKHAATSRRYNEQLEKGISDFNSAPELKVHLQKTLDNYSELVKDGGSEQLQKSLDDYISNLDDASFQDLKGSRSKLKTNELLKEITAKTAKAADPTIAKSDIKFMSKLLESCSGKKNLTTAKNCISGFFKSATSPLWNLFKRRYPCLGNNKMFFADFLLGMGFFTGNTLAVYMDGKTDSKDIPYEFLANTLMYATKNGELGCRAAKGKVGKVNVGESIDVKDMYKANSSFKDMFIPMLRTQSQSALTLSALQVGFDHMLDRDEKTSLKSLALQYPGKVLYLGVWGSIKGIAISRYVKGKAVSLLVQKYEKLVKDKPLPKVMKDNLVAQLVLLTGIDKFGIGFLNSLDYKYTGQQFLFPLPELIISALAYDNLSKEEKENLPNDERLYMESSSQGLKEALSDLGLTRDDIVFEKSDNGVPKIRIKDKGSTNKAISKAL